LFLEKLIHRFANTILKIRCFKTCRCWNY